MTCVHLNLAQPHSDVEGGDNLGFWHKVLCRVRLPSVLQAAAMLVTDASP